MDGSTSVALRQQYVNQFNDVTNTECHLFLISTKAGGIGINLVGANRAIIFDACWNPAIDTQAIFRLYRFGQTKEVFIYRLLAQGTMEEKIYLRQIWKIALSLRVVDKEQQDRHFTSAQLRDLYAFTPDIWTNCPVAFEMPADGLLRDLLISCQYLIAKYHEHDSLLENRSDQELSETDKQLAWIEYEKEKRRATLKSEQSLHKKERQPVPTQVPTNPVPTRQPLNKEEQLAGVRPKPFLMQGCGDCGDAKLAKKYRITYDPLSKNNVGKIIKGLIRCDFCQCESSVHWRRLLIRVSGKKCVICNGCFFSHDITGHIKTFLDHIIIILMFDEVQTPTCATAEKRSATQMEENVSSSCTKKIKKDNSPLLHNLLGFQEKFLTTLCKIAPSVPHNYN